jgi:hypothetical protein
MANRYWVGGTGNWSDAANHWAATSNGAPGAGNAPTTSDMCIFDGSSFGSTGLTVTYDSGSCGSIDWTNATNSPTFTLGANLVVNGSLTFISGMTFTPATYRVSVSGTGISINSGGKSFYTMTILGTVTLLNNVTATSSIASSVDTLDMGGFVVQTPTLTIRATQTIDMGGGTLKVRHFNDADSGTAFAAGGTLDFYTGSTQTINGGTAGVDFSPITINQTYLSTVTVSGANTFGAWTIKAGSTVNFTSGVTQTISSDITVDGTGTAVTLKAVTTDSVATLSVASGKYVWAKNCTIADVAISGSGAGYYSDGSTVDAQSTGWTAGSPSTLKSATDTLLVKLTETAIATSIVLTATKDGAHIDLSWS